MTRPTLIKNMLNVALLGAVLGLSSCAPNEATTPSSPASTAPLTQVISRPDGTVLGNLTLEELGADGTKITVSVAGISPGAHAMHFHETGKCEAPDFKSSGGHYNPTGASHGIKMADGPHAGDMMNVDVAADGTGKFTVTNNRVSIHGEHGLPALMDANGTALILHAGADDYESQPSGAAGARIGCAVVGGEASPFQLQ